MTRSTTGGTIRHLERRDLWEARWTGADGRRHSVYAKTRDDVRAALRKKLDEADSGIRPASGRLTVGQWLDEWLETAVRPRLRPSTVASYAYVVEKHLAPHVGRIVLAKLTPEDVGRLLARLAETDLSPTSQRYVLSILRIALGRAEKSGRVTRNVARLVDAPRKSTPEMRSLTADEVGVLLRALRGHRLEPLVITAIGTELRQGELLALRWRDLDLDGGTVTVQHTLRRGTRTLGEPKTARARRTVELPSSVVAILAEHKRRRVVRSLDADGDYVFTTATGRPLDSRNLTQDFQAELAKARLPRVRWHDLRHTTASLILEQGEELGIVSRILGHSDFSTTADVYAHLTRKMLGRAASRIEVVLGEAVTR